MGSEHCETALVPYLRGLLDVEERRSVAHHLEQCAECRNLATSFEPVLGALAHQVEVLPSPDWRVYRAELGRRIAARKGARASWWPARVAWASLATAAAAGLALVLALRLGTRTTVPLPLDQLAMGNEINDVDLGLLRDYPVVEDLDLLDNYDVIERLDELPPTIGRGNEARS